MPKIPFHRYDMSMEGQTDDPAKSIYASLLGSIGGALPAAAMSTLRMIGPGAYSRLTDPMMGFNAADSGRMQKGFGEQQYPYRLPVQIQLRGQSPWEDEIAGMNFQHAMARALRNWPGASVVPLISNLK